MIRLFHKSFLIGLLFSASVTAAPSISGVSGTISTMSTGTITGANFGSKSPAKPHLFANFEQGSINPTSSGTVTSWDEVQGMSYGAAVGLNGSGGVEGSGDTTSPVTYTLRADYGSGYTANNQKSYIYRKEKFNFDITDASQNSKLWRLWSSQYPNIYGLTQNGLVNVEDCAGTGFYGAGINAWQTANEWDTNEIFLKASSAVDVKDGTLEQRNNGQEYLSGNVMTKCGTRTDNMTENYVAHAVFSNIGSWNPSVNWSTAKVWYDEIYVDITWARVMLSNTQNIADATNLIPQIPTSWSSGQIEILYNTAGFSNGSTAYIIVCDSNDSCSTGSQVTVNGEGGGPPPEPPADLNGGRFGDYIIDTDFRDTRILVGG